MRRLSISAPFRTGESPAGFLSRLAQANGIETMRQLGLDLALDVQGVIHGHEAALEALAGLAGCSLTDLRAWAPSKTPDGVFMRGQNLGPFCRLRRAQIFVCPFCIAEDLADETLSFVLRPWHRSIWQVRSMRTCAVHCQSLVEACAKSDVNRVGDFSALLLPALPNLQLLASRSMARPPSPLEVHLADRLSDAWSPSAAFVDPFPLYAEARLAERIGSVVLAGPQARIETFDDDDLHEAGATGFEILSGGESRIREMLSELQVPFQAGSADWGARAFYGQLYTWLADHTHDPALDPMRDLISRHIVETLPIGPGEVLFGKEVARRRIHSVRSASLEYGVHPKRLRKVLRDAGLLHDDHESRSDERVTFPVEEAERLLREYADGMSLVQAATYLNAPRPHERLLFEAGFIRPIVVGGTADLKAHTLSRSELDAFLARLTANAGPDFDGSMDIPSAARLADCRAMEVVTLILENCLRVGTDTKTKGYLSVKVDVEEVRKLVRLPEHGGMSLRKVAKILACGTEVVSALTSQSLLETSIVRNPVKRCRQPVVTPEVLSAFCENYVSLMTLAKERGIHFRRLLSSLERYGIQPAQGFEDVPATFYRRLDLLSLPPP